MYTPEDRKQRLVNFGADALAEALLELADVAEAADDLVERMIATPDQKRQRLQQKWASLLYVEDFVPWKASGDLADRLSAILADIEATETDPRKGVELVVDFFASDTHVFERCDDSGGFVSAVYIEDAKDLFLKYARRCEDKEWLTGVVLDLSRDDPYCVRDCLLECAAEYLPESNIRQMISHFQKLAAQDPKGQSHWFRLILTLARQIRDADLYERTRVRCWTSPDSVSPSACLDIAKVYLECGDASKALSWLEFFPLEDSYPAEKPEEMSFEEQDEMLLEGQGEIPLEENDGMYLKEHEVTLMQARDEILLEVYGQLGQQDKVVECAWRLFRHERSLESLDALLIRIGEADKDQILADEVEVILTEPLLRLSDAEFLIAIGQFDAAERYLLQRSTQINGYMYWALPSLAEALESSGAHLAATLIYRALLDSILARGYSRAYSHGARYLKRLDRMAPSIAEWQRWDDHSTYIGQLRQNHGRKRSFWSKYEGKVGK